TRARAVRREVAAPSRASSAKWPRSNGRAKRAPSESARTPTIPAIDRASGRSSAASGRAARPSAGGEGDVTDDRRYAARAGPSERVSRTSLVDRRVAAPLVSAHLGLTWVALLRPAR